jgi:hypothetical protein
MMATAMRPAEAGTEPCDEEYDEDEGKKAERE